MSRLAFFSPLPPSKSGIADYSQALLDELRRFAEVVVFENEPAGFDPKRYDGILYQIGNNPFHEGAYRAALKHPGIVVLHEFNLHHLVAELTIKRNDWDAYLRELDYDSGAEALAFGQKVRALEAGPDYEGVPMVRRLLEASRGVIVHSHYVERKVRETGFQGPLAVIPHGAWTPDPDRMDHRHQLGLDETVPLIGIFGFLKPYKRITESLRAFRRLLHLEPRAKMILVGEPHPDLDLPSRIRSLGLAGAVRILGFVPMERFAGLLAACDIVLNLRYPTVGESSGTLLRAFGLGRAALVSDVGSFQELPNDICLKVPVGSGEEDLIFEYLNLLVSRSDLRRALGRRARAWAERTCDWRIVAGHFAAFIEAVAAGHDWEPPAPAESQTQTELNQQPPVSDEYMLGWAGQEKGSKVYAQTHLSRLQRTIEIIPPGGAEDRILEMGAYMQITPALKFKLGYGEVRGCYYGPSGQVDHKTVVSEDGQEFECSVDLFDAEKDRFPYPDGHFTTVLCCELIEHLFADPMHMMSEINRVLKPNGHLVLTTPNISSLRAIAGILLGYHPGFFPAYLRPAEEGSETDARHNREYTPKEIARLLIEAGFAVTLIETGPFRDEPKPEHAWVEHLLERYCLATDLRGDGIYAVGRKTGAVQERFPEWLYS